MLLASFLDLFLPFFSSFIPVFSLNILSTKINNSSLLYKMQRMTSEMYNRILGKALSRNESCMLWQIKRCLQLILQLNFLLEYILSTAGHASNTWTPVTCNPHGRPEFSWFMYLVNLLSTVLRTHSNHHKEKFQKPKRKEGREGGREEGRAILCFSFSNIIYFFLNLM